MLRSLLVVMVMVLFPWPASTQTPVSQTLHSGWKVKQARLNNWYPATVPGTVHTDLIANKILEDPYFRLNERGAQWVDKEDWIYETTFTPDADVVSKQNIRLHFEGLDTYADVYLNDEKLLEANNMFRRWDVPVKTKLKAGENTLRIYFHSPIKIGIPMFDALPYKLEAANDQSQNGGVFDKKVSVFIRKAGYHFGWDWGPRLVTSGIWKPVRLEAWNDLKLEDVFYHQKNVTARQADVNVIVEISATKAGPATLKVLDENGEKMLAQKPVNLAEGLNKVEVPFSVKNPQLWWSRGLGKAHLYNFRTEIESNGAIADIKKDRIGLRSVKVINKPDDIGKTFYIELNGVPVFAKGANYIPNDVFLPRVTESIYKKSIDDAVAANMNMLRIWGGGIYENKMFYDLCDEQGIMVWQDFMYACSLYPAEGELLENMRLEAIDNVRRLRNHASIALWCGNNENNDAWFGWGWKQNYERLNPEWAKTIWDQLVTQFYVMLPKVVEENDPGKFYWPSSPHSEKGVRANNVSGDLHYWGVWHAKEPVEKYNVVRSRFFSEYGFQSFPEFASVKKYAPEARDWDIYSEVMMSHQRGGAFANGLIETYLLNEYQKPKNFEMFLYMNQVLQGDAIRTAMEAHRRDMPYCMGSLYWQHNDVWPVASWSARDYYGRWKAMQYYAVKAFDDILVSPIRKDNKLNIYIVNDRLTRVRGNLLVELRKLDGNVIRKMEKRVTLEPNVSANWLDADIEEWLNGNPESDVMVFAQFTENGGRNYSNNYALIKQKDMNYGPAKLTVQSTPAEGGYNVSIGADRFARAVFLALDGVDNFFSDNYFDVWPGERKTIHVKSGLPQAEFDKQLKVVSLVDGYSSP